MKEYEIKTTTKDGGYIFLTRANNGKEALQSLINYSNDYKHILGLKESKKMTIKIKELNIPKHSKVK